MEQEEAILPHEVLIQIISHLKVADVRSCRLVCRRWHSCCEDRIITRAQILEFHSALHLASEINEFLKSLKRSRVNVRLMKMDLKELNFEKFGRKIDELELINCFVDVDTLKNLFYVTSNMTHLRVQFISYRYVRGPPPEILDIAIWNTVINFLYEEKFQNLNLKEFKSNLRQKRFILSNILFIFPRMRNILLWDSIRMIDAPELSILPKSNITDFGSEFEMRFDKNVAIFESSFLRLKTLNLKISFWDALCSFSSVWERVFSHLTELEDLTLIFTVVGIGRSHEKVVKALLFQILKSCPRLGQLKLSLWPENTGNIVIMNREEIQEFSSLITKIKSLRLPEMHAELNFGETMATLPNSDGLLKDLQFKANFCGPFDLRFMIMKTYQLTALSLVIKTESVFTNFEKILQSQKCLQSFKIFTQMKRMDVFQMKFLKVIGSKHERLNHLEYIFEPTGKNCPIDYLITRLCSWEFPNLLTLVVSAKDYTPTEWMSLTATHESENIFRKWIGRMRTLTTIDVHINPVLLKFEDCVQIWEQMPHLQKIHWTFPEICKLQRGVIVNLFDNLPNLRSMSHANRNEWFRYSRSKQQLFRRRSGDPETIDYDLIEDNEFLGIGKKCSC